MTTMLTTYEAFVARVESLGFMALSEILPGLPSLGGETPASAWHTGLDTDPWRWKDRVAEEKRLAYGCILGKHKGFVSARMYPVFYAAFHPVYSISERQASGTLSQKTGQLWKLFEEKGMLNVSQIRQSLGSGSGVDSAVQQLQQEYYITVDGNDRKLSAKGEVYGWPVIRYRRVIDWAPAGWLDNTKAWSVEAARESILDEGVAMSDGVKRQALAKKLGLG